MNDFTLRGTVPEQIRAQFNISKNLLLYAWFVYPFFSVSEMHILSVLELALKTRIGDKGLNELRKLKKKRGLFSYIEYAQSKKWIANTDFRAYHRAPNEIARHEYMLRKLEEMKEKGLDWIDLDFDDIKVPETNSIDYIGVLLDTVNEIRNTHAHGETLLYPASVWRSFEMVSDFVNALFPETPK